MNALDRFEVEQIANDLAKRHAQRVDSTAAVCMLLVLGFAVIVALGISIYKAEQKIEALEKQVVLLLEKS